MNKKPKKTLDHIRLTFDQLRMFCNMYESRKFRSNSVGWLKAYIVYQWVYTWQILTGVGYAKARKKDIFKQIEYDLREPKPNVVVATLVRMGFLTWGSSEYNGKMVLCLQCTYLNDKNNVNNDNPIEQPQQKKEVDTIVVPSRDDANGEFRRFGYRYYKDPDGQTHLDYNGNPQAVPNDAPARPSLTAYWDESYSQWFEPGQEPYRPDDF